jgi:hypothetical protein
MLVLATQYLITSSMDSKINLIVKYCSKKLDFTTKFCILKSNNFIKYCEIKTSFFIKLCFIKFCFNNTEFSSDNRETFLTLKNVALKQNDQIKALEFHTQEYQIHLKALRENKTNKNLSDRFVLTFESWVSAFGTNVILSIMSFVGVVILFYVLINGFNYDAKTIVDFVSPRCSSLRPVKSLLCFQERSYTRS